MRIDPHFGYNRELSDRLPDNRSLPDGRPSSCRRLYGTRAAAVGSPPLLRTAVVIVEWNEATSALRRTVRSVLDRSPRHLLDQIVVVDDASAWEVRHPFLPYVAHPFSSYLRIEFSFWKVSPAIRALPLVSYVRNARREGLMRSRVVGFHHSSAPTVTFLDSHCEVTPGWLPPLLERVTLNQSTVVAPVSLTAPILSTCHSACLPIARERLLPF
jgi:polypeptide N-acetylgalactosaminyltransferase|tara:strand:- start:599 stop:1240 length:642 start_codon:yes stop_codon:yes gene_type:complete